MLSPFATLLDIVYQNPHMGINALYTDSAGVSKPVRLIETHQDELTPFLSTGIQQRTVMYEVRRSQMPARPVSGEQIDIDGETFVIRKAQPDTLGLSWTLDVEPQ